MGLKIGRSLVTTSFIILSTPAHVPKIHLDSIIILERNKNLDGSKTRESEIFHKFVGKFDHIYN